ncbi:MAG: NmrA family protein [Gemmatimonadetes bacterium 13_1_40CM_70_11]|nr:MAG: NmrA family protein [Gemmatimonadetes bacterium 13_1_40CM_70_11]
MILVVGATGLLGGEICRRLATADKPIRAMVRPTANPTRVENLKALGATLVQGDLRNRASLDAACEGVTAVITTVSTTLSRQPGDSIQTVDLDGQLRLIDAAKTARVRQFIYVSFSHHLDVDCPLTTAKRTVEASLKRSGLNYTILAPTFFMEVWLSPTLGFDAGKGTAQIYGSGATKIGWISLNDVAQFAVACLDNPAARHATIELGGPEALSPLDVVRCFEEAGGRKFQVEHVTEDVLNAQKAATSDPLQQSFAALMIGYAHGDPIDMRKTLQQFPISLLSVREYARGVVRA